MLSHLCTVKSISKYFKTIKYRNSVSLELANSSISLAGLRRDAQGINDGSRVAIQAQHGVSGSYPQITYRKRRQYPGGVRGQTVAFTFSGPVSTRARRDRSFPLRVTTRDMYFHGCIALSLSAKACVSFFFSSSGSTMSLAIDVLLPRRIISPGSGSTSSTGFTGLS